MLLFTIMPCDVTIFFAIILNQLADILKALAAVSRYTADLMKKPSKIWEDLKETDLEEKALDTIKNMVSQTTMGLFGAVTHFVQTELKNLYQKNIGKYLDEYGAYIQLGLMGLDVFPLMLAYTVTVIQGYLQKEIEYLGKIIHNINIIIGELHKLFPTTNQHDELIKRTAEMIKQLLIHAKSNLNIAKDLADSCENYEQVRARMNTARRQLRAVLALLDFKQYGYRVDSFEEINKLPHRHRRFEETMKHYFKNAAWANIKQELLDYKNSASKIMDAVQEIAVIFGKEYFHNHLRLLGQLRMYSFLRLVVLGQLKYVDCKFEKVRLSLKHEKLLDEMIEQLDVVTEHPFRHTYVFPFVMASTAGLLELLRDFRPGEDLKAQIQKVDVSAYIYTDGYHRVTDQLRRLINIAKAIKSSEKAIKDLRSIRRVVEYQLTWATKLSQDLSTVATLSNEQLLQLEQTLAKLGVSPAEFQEFMTSDAMAITMATVGYSMYGINTLLDCLKVSPQKLVDKVESYLRPKFMKKKTKMESTIQALNSNQESLRDAWRNLKKAFKDLRKASEKLRQAFPKEVQPSILDTYDSIVGIEIGLA